MSYWIKDKKYPGTQKKLQGIQVDHQQAEGQLDLLGLFVIRTWAKRFKYLIVMIAEACRREKANTYLGRSGLTSCFLKLQKGKSINLKKEREKENEEVEKSMTDAEYSSLCQYIDINNVRKITGR